MLNRTNLLFLAVLISYTISVQFWQSGQPDSKTDKFYQNNSPSHFPPLTPKGARRKVPFGGFRGKLNSNYTIEDGLISGTNTGRYNNRPLYINNSNAFILTGDQPIARLGQNQYMYGTFMAGVKRKGKTKWLQQCSQVKSFYGTGTMKWEVSDNDFPGLIINLEILPMASSTGMVISSSAKGVMPGDSLVWAFGGAKWFEKQNLSWKMDVMGQPELLTWGFDANDCRNNRVKTEGRNYIIRLDSTMQKEQFKVAGSCSATTKVSAGDASSSDFTPGKVNSLPILRGSIPLIEKKTVYWAFRAFDGDEKIDFSETENPEAAFAKGYKRIDSFNKRLQISTPDAYLNAIARASVVAIDGTWYPPVFVHGAMQWNSRFPGWRTIFGGTMYGWHDRVKAEAKFYTDSQVKKSDKIEAKADPASLLTEQHADSRFYGVGRITRDQKFYDMQTQFFDQIVEEYRWTADPELIKFFREALELHLIWLRDCFDPDGDGIFESYINTWPTDSQWYNGGGCAEETSYAYRGHLAARDMARNAGDKEAENYHNRMLEKIRKGFFSKLWIPAKGYSGSYREQGGHERLHTDPWLYSIFLPVDAGLLTPDQAIESVYYSEWALQNDRMPYGGRQVWTSNWLPGIWSVRELWPGDNYHLALSYFQSGLPEDGYDIFRGTFLRTAFNHISPGNLGGVQGGIDFGDCIHPFARTLVSGLFGYMPDYPNRKVKIAPQLPPAWDNASIDIPDVKISFARSEGKISYSFRLAQQADLELVMPVQAREIRNVMLDGRKTAWKMKPGIGCTLVAIEMNSATAGEVSIETSGPLPYFAPEMLTVNIGEQMKVTAKDAKIISIKDPQNILDSEKIEKGVLSGKITGTKGFHTLLAEVKSGATPQLRVYRIRINDPAGDAQETGRFVEKIPSDASFVNISISGSLNANISAIYKQQYLSPRMNTVSVRLGTDGYSPWTFWHWKSLPPEIKTDKVKAMLDKSNRLVTPQGIPFAWNAGEKNVAFTSMWDNYPDKIDFPVNQAGDAIWFLVSGSTNVMQCQIANAVIRLNYADGITDSLELVPPVNYWILSTIDSHATAPGQGSRTDYTSETDRFCLPAKLPETVSLGENCRAMLLNLKMRRGVVLKSVTLEAMSQEVVVGMMGMTIMKQK